MKLVMKFLILFCFINFNYTIAQTQIIPLNKITNKSTMEIFFSDGDLQYLPKSLNFKNNDRIVVKNELLLKLTSKGGFIYTKGASMNSLTSKIVITFKHSKNDTFPFLLTSQICGLQLKSGWVAFKNLKSVVSIFKSSIIRNSLSVGSISKKGSSTMKNLEQ